MSDANSIEMHIHIDEQHYQIQLRPEIATHAAEFYARMDQDMDHGWRMGPQFVGNPNPIQRAQIAADRLMAAIETSNETMVQGMLGYILARQPAVRRIRIDTNGEPLETLLLDGSGQALN